MTDSRSANGRAGVVFGIILIAVGGIMFADRFLGIDFGRVGWPLIVVAVGVVILVLGLSTKGNEGQGLAVGGAITAVVGAVLAVQDATGQWATWAYAWALVGPGASGLGLAAYGLVHRDPAVTRNGLGALGTGLALFVGFGLFFEGVIGLSGTPFLSTDIGPIVILAVGVVILLAGLVRGRSSSST